MSGNDNNAIYRMAFASLPVMTLEIAGRIMSRVSSEKEFFELNDSDAIQAGGVRSKSFASDVRQRYLDRATKELDFITKHKIELLYYTDFDYPQRLLDTPDAPLMLYTTGYTELNKVRMISIVGTRRATVYGAKMCDILVKNFAETVPGAVIVSGLAYGTDINAHRAAMKYGLPTVAVQARGLNKIYPSPHRDDAVEIVRHGGMIMTDYMSQDEIHRGNFLARNRIIAALSDCTIVIESAETGGSLVTARLAASYNRKVFAVPGRATDVYSTGCNQLIGRGAAISVSSASDVLDIMNWQPPQKAADDKQLEIFPNLNEDEMAIVDLLRESENGMHAVDIAAVMRRPLYQVLSTLVDLDSRQIIVALPGNRYAIL